MAFTLNDLVLRLVKGSPLTWDEADGNLTKIKAFCDAIGNLFNSDGTIDQTLLQTVILNYLATNFASSTAGYFPPIGHFIQMPKAMAVTASDNGANWLLADGTKQLQASFPKLFAYFGNDFVDADDPAHPNTFGGAVNTATEFRIPNLQGRAIIGSGT